MTQPPPDDDPTIDEGATRQDPTVADNADGKTADGNTADPGRTLGIDDRTVEQGGFQELDEDDSALAELSELADPGTDGTLDLSDAGAADLATRRSETLAAGRQKPAPDDRTAGAQRSLTAIRDAGRSRHDRQALPERISRYETISLLGEGAFGIVVKSHDPKLDREVAVKIQKINSIQSTSGVDRFLREARSAAQLRHPGIVPVFEYGEFAENHFIVYQFIEGETLAQWNRNSQPSLRGRVETIARISEALDYAHSLGIVHRDIKPANILVDRLEQPHVADFGCARMDSGDVSATVDGSLMGTPAYMSPEVVAGNARTADGRADIWAVGVMLYELLCGERPFQGKMSELFRQIPNTPVRPLRQIDSTIPVDLQTICQKCLEKEPDRRFQTGAELAADLRRWMDGMPITSRRNSLARRTWLWAKRKPALATMLGILAGTLILITVASVLFSVNLQNKQNEIVASQMTSLASADAAALPVIIDNLSRLDPSVSSQLRSSLRNNAEASGSERARYELAAWALETSAGHSDPQLLESLVEYLPQASAEELPVMVNLAADGLRDHTESLWAVARTSLNSNPQRLRAFCALAVIDPENPQWPDQSQALAGMLLDEDPQQLANWTTMLQPVAEYLVEDLETWYFTNRRLAIREKSGEVLAFLFRDQADRLGQWALDGQPGQIGKFRSALQARSQETIRWADSVSLEPGDPGRQANLIMIRALAGDDRQLIDELSADAIDPTLRSTLINRCSPAGVDPRRLSAVLEDEDAPATLVYSVLLALGHYDQQQIYLAERRDLLPHLTRLFTKHPDAGVHSAARWLMNHWDFGQQVEQSLPGIQSKQPLPGHGWHEDSNGICFAVFEPGTAWQSGPPPVADPVVDADVRLVNLPVRFGISATETSAKDYLQWEEQLRQDWEESTAAEPELWHKRAARLKRNRKNNPVPPSDCPMVKLSWHDAALFCNQLSETQGPDEAQPVYQLDTPQKTEWLFSPHQDGLQRTGYRMPTGAEWEFAVRAGSATQYFFGSAVELIDEYGWSVGNSDGEVRPVGQLQPNRFGLFDGQGNAEEWCHNVFDLQQADDSGFYYPREVRDQSCAEESGDLNVFRREGRLQDLTGSRLGFRIARTYPATGSGSGPDRP